MKYLTNHKRRGFARYIFPAALLIFAALPLANPAQASAVTGDSVCGTGKPGRYILVTDKFLTNKKTGERAKAKLRLFMNTTNGDYCAFVVATGPAKDETNWMKIDFKRVIRKDGPGHTVRHHSDAGPRQGHTKDMHWTASQHPSIIKHVATGEMKRDGNHNSATITVYN